MERLHLNGTVHKEADTVKTETNRERKWQAEKKS
jgi:hypothetical protein